MRTFRLKTALAIAGGCLMVFSPGCEKYDTEISYNIAAHLDIPDADTLIPYSRFIDVFYHFADTTDWEVCSYQDAARGIIRRRDDKTVTREPDGVGVPSGNVVTVGPFTSGPVLLVAYDGDGHGEYESKMYGWREISVEAGLAQVRVAVIFTPEKSGWKDSYTLAEYPDPISREVHVNSKWFMANDNPYVVPSTGGNQGGDNGNGNGGNDGGDDGGNSGGDGGNSGDDDGGNGGGEDGNGDDGGNDTGDGGNG